MSKLTLLGYYGSGNVGDAIQTLALESALMHLYPEDSPYTYTSRNALSTVREGNVLVNGWLRTEKETPDLRKECRARFRFCGIHTVGFPSMIDWLRFQNDDVPVGCRDPWTFQSLRKQGIPIELVGCATLALQNIWPKGAQRSGAYAVDVKPKADETKLTHLISKDMSWEAQRAEASRLLCLYMQAELVRTNRLHVILPCLAFGTPVQWEGKASVFQPERFSILEILGCKDGEVLEGIDCSGITNVFYAHLKKCRDSLYE